MLINPFIFSSFIPCCESWSVGRDWAALVSTPLVFGTGRDHGKTRVLQRPAHRRAAGDHVAVDCGRGRRRDAGKEPATRMHVPWR